MAERLYVRLNGDGAPGPETSAPATTFRDAEVPAPLAPFVASIQRYREDLGEQEVIERVIPDGALRLAFNFGWAPTAATGDGQYAEVIGASMTPALVRLRGRMDGLTVTLRSGAALALLGVPARELAETALPLDALWPSEAARLRQRMLEAKSDGEQVALLQQSLLSRLESMQAASDHGAAARATELLARAQGKLSVRELAAQIGVGERRLQQLFHEHVGLSPRSYARLTRMHALLRALRRPAARPWARLALDAGYYDQAHLANEFRALCGVSPGAFLARISGSSKTGAEREGKLCQTNNGRRSHE